MEVYLFSEKCLSLSHEHCFMEHFPFKWLMCCCCSSGVARCLQTAFLQQRSLACSHKSKQFHHKESLSNLLFTPNLFEGVDNSKSNLKWYNLPRKTNGICDSLVKQVHIYITAKLFLWQVKHCRDGQGIPAIAAIAVLTKTRWHQADNFPNMPSL